MNRGLVLAFGMFLSAGCGQASAPANDAAFSMLDMLLYSGVKNVTAMAAGPDGTLWLALEDGRVARVSL